MEWPETRKWSWKLHSYTSQNPLLVGQRSKRSTQAKMISSWYLSLRTTVSQTKGCACFMFEWRINQLSNISIWADTNTAAFPTWHTGCQGFIYCHRKFAEQNKKEKRKECRNGERWKGGWEVDLIRIPLISLSDFDAVSEHVNAASNILFLRAPLPLSEQAIPVYYLSLIFFDVVSDDLRSNQEKTGLKATWH